MSDVTVIGNSIFISGNIEGKEDLSVRGRIEGNIALDNTLFLEESGVIKADVVVKNIVISGILIGNIEAQESVEITNIGQMVGDIIAPRIVIRDGAKFRGNIEMGLNESSQNDVKKIESSSFSRPALKPGKSTNTPRKSFGTTETKTKVTPAPRRNFTNKTTTETAPAVNDKLNAKESEKIKKAVEETVKDTKKDEKKKELTEVLKNPKK